MLIFKIRSSSARSYHKNKSARFSGEVFGVSGSVGTLPGRSTRGLGLGIKNGSNVEHCRYGPGHVGFGHQTPKFWLESWCGVLCGFFFCCFWRKFKRSPNIHWKSPPQYSPGNLFGKFPLRFPREARDLIFKIRSYSARSDLKNKQKNCRKCLIFKIRSYSARSDLKNKIPRFSGFCRGLSWELSEFSLPKQYSWNSAPAVSLFL